MKQFLLILSLFLTFSISAQLNMTQIGFLDLATMHSTELNDIWGYTDEDGNEYAIVGCFDGTSVVDISDPTTPVEIAWFPGTNSVWRDIKTVGDYAYVTTEANDGLFIIDMSPLPGSTTLPTNTYFGPGGDPWQSAHNLYADDSGYVYIVGANRDNGGIIILEVMTDPMNPVEVGIFDTWYAHDIYVYNDTGYVSHVADGIFSIIDLTDKAAPVFINSQSTIDGVTHNAWLSQDGDYLFMTDEDPDGYIASYDISNPLSISLVDQVQSSPGSNIIPHNTHVLGDYLVTSYYTDGVVVHDVSDPASMTEVANFDTSPSYAGGTFNGCWGVYPYFESEVIAASDTEEGLYLLQADFLFASHLQGVITDLDTGLPINDAEITIVVPDVTDESEILGDYTIGTFEEGTFDVLYSKTDYTSQTISVYLENGTITVQDVQLDKIPNFSIDVTVLDAATLAPVEGADVRIQHSLESESGLTDAAGMVTVPLYYEDNYEIFAGKWGYVTECLVDVYLGTGSPGVTVYINTGIYDDFTFDFGWGISGDAVSGMWEREDPVGIFNMGNVESPFDDITVDCADQAYLTGNGTVISMADEVDSGAVNLSSPFFDLTSFASPAIHFSTFFANHYGATSPDDSLTVYMSNGTDNAIVLVRNAASTSMGEWVAHEIKVNDYMTPSATMQLFITTNDVETTPHLVEAGFDHFYVSEKSMNDQIENEIGQILIYPNPFTNQIQIKGIDSGTIELIDLSGRRVFESQIVAEVDLGDLKAGVYYMNVFNNQGVQVDVQRLVKI